MIEAGLSVGPRWLLGLDWESFGYAATQGSE